MRKSPLRFEVNRCDANARIEGNPASASVVNVAMLTKLQRSLIGTTAVLCAALQSGLAAADIKGNVFESKGGDAPLLIWDATPAIIDVVNAKAPRLAALHMLEANGIDLAAQRLAGLTAAKRVTIRMIYQKIGAVNPDYGAATLAGIERVYELSASADALRHNHAALAAALAAGKTPPAVRLAITGALPPMPANAPASPH